MKTTRFKFALGAVSATFGPHGCAGGDRGVCRADRDGNGHHNCVDGFRYGAGRRLGAIRRVLPIHDHQRHGTTFGCTATPITGPNGNELCTGQSDDTNAEWPAITTVGAPIAGSGVSQGLLGTVTRTFEGVGSVGGAGPVTQQQITYAGHPLYLFDQGPGQVTGEGWDEPSMPPWQGVWSLISPSGLALPWVGTLTTTTIDGQTVHGDPDAHRCRVGRLPGLQLQQ